MILREHEITVYFSFLSYSASLQHTLWAQEVLTLDNWNHLLWSAALPLLLLTGLLLTLHSRGFALRHIGTGIRLSWRNAGSGGSTSPFACLCTSLASTIGTGNIAGVAFALTAGGPGALVWMWIAAALSTAVKYAECAQGSAYRITLKNGHRLGGTMVTLTHLPFRRLGLLLGGVYALLEVFTTLSAANLVQSSAIAQTLWTSLSVPPMVCGVLVGGFVLAILLGGADSVTRFSAWIVPLMIGLYLFGGLAVVFTHLAALPQAIYELFHQAFSLSAMGAGTLGNTIRVGVIRCCFSNESGTGSAAFSAALSDADPIDQGLISATSNLWDTGIMCSITGLSILVSGTLSSGLTGVPLVMETYASGLGGTGRWIVAVCLVLFAFSSLPGLAFQGESALLFLSDGPLARGVYRLGFALLSALGCLFSTEQALLTADLCNALLILLNMIALWWVPIPKKSDF